MKKILIIDRTLPDVGGVRTYVSNLKLLLEQMGCNVDVYCTKWNGSIWDKYFIGGVRFLINKVYRPYGIVVDARLFGFMARYILPNGYDFYIYQGGLVNIGKKRKNNSICIVHTVWTDMLQGKNVNTSAREKVFEFEKDLLRSNHKTTFTVSEGYANYLTKRYGLSKQIKYINNFLVDDYLSKNWCERDIDIAFTGQFNEVKNVLYIIDLAELLREYEFKANLKVLIIGFGPLEKRIRNNIREKKLEEIIEIIISPPRESIKHYLSRTKLFLLPSHKESFSYSLLEAKLSGCVTMANRSLGVPKGFIDFPISIDDYSQATAVALDVLSNQFKPNPSANANFINLKESAKTKYAELLQL